MLYVERHEVGIFHKHVRRVFVEQYPRSIERGVRSSRWAPLTGREYALWYFCRAVPCAVNTATTPTHGRRARVRGTRIVIFGVFARFLAVEKLFIAQMQGHDEIDIEN